MADNVTLPATGTGTSGVVQATDDVSGVHYPKVKLVDGTADGATAVAAGNGAAAGALRVTLANDGTGIVALTTSSAAIGKLAANSGVDIGDVDVTSVSGTVTVAGDVAHGASDSGNPQKVAAKAISDVAGATMVSAAQRTDLYAGLDGVLLVRPYASIANSLSERVSITSGTDTACATNFTAVASTKNCITSIVAFNTSTTVSTYVDIKSGTGGTILLSLPLPAGGGAVVNLPVPIATAANTALAYQVASAATTVYITFVGFKSKA